MEKRKRGLSPGLIGFGLVLLVAAGGFLAGRRNQSLRDAARAEARGKVEAPGLPTPAQQAAVAEATKQLAVLSPDRPDFARFHESWSAATERMRLEHPGVIPPAQAALAIHAALGEMGYDPSATILYWASPQFREDVAARNPDDVTSATRTVDYLLSVALCDGLADEDFTRVLANYSPAVWSVARQRRAARP
jgi:hypothetical protein